METPAASVACRIPFRGWRDARAAKRHLLCLQSQQLAEGYTVGHSLDHAGPESPIRGRGRGSQASVLPLSVFSEDFQHVTTPPSDTALLESAGKTSLSLKLCRRFRIFNHPWSDGAIGHSKSLLPSPETEIGPWMLHYNSVTRVNPFFVW